MPTLCELIPVDSHGQLPSFLGLGRSVMSRLTLQHSHTSRQSEADPVDERALTGVHLRPTLRGGCNGHSTCS
jgi:hypothetical protein